MQGVGQLDKRRSGRGLCTQRLADSRTAGSSLQRARPWPRSGATPATMVSPQRVGAPCTGQTSDHGQLQKTGVEGSDGDTTQRQRYPCASIWTALPRSWCHTPCGSGAGSLPKATLPRCLRGARPCRSSSERSRPGVRHSPLSPGRHRAGSAHHLWPAFQSNPSPLHKAAARLGPGARAGGSVSRCRRSPCF